MPANPTRATGALLIIVAVVVVVVESCQTGSINLAGSIEPKTVEVKTTNSVIDATDAIPAKRPLNSTCPGDWFTLEE
jgi:hypothetical protein